MSFIKCINQFLKYDILLAQMLIIFYPYLKKEQKNQFKTIKILISILFLYNSTLFMITPKKQQSISKINVS